LLESKDGVDPNFKELEMRLGDPKPFLAYITFESRAGFHLACEVFDKDLIDKVYDDSATIYHAAERKISSKIDPSENEWPEDCDLIKNKVLRSTSNPDLVIWENSKTYHWKLWLLILIIIGWEFGLLATIRLMCL